METRTVNNKSKFLLLNKIYKQRYLLLMTLPFVIWVFVFCYMPIWGWIMAFQNYNPAEGILGSSFVGLKHFIDFVTDDMFFIIMRNTIAISLLNILGGTFASILLALLLNEMSNLLFKKVVQTISYLPHFISYIVIGNIFLTILSPTGGLVNDILMGLNIIDKPIFFFSIPKLFWFLLSYINIWKEAGWGAIIYLAAISAIDAEQYEAASIDGAGRFKKMIHITMPSIKSTVVILLILNSGHILSAGFEPSFILGNPLVSNYSEVIDTYVYTMGIKNNMFSYATAVGLFKMVVSLIIILVANKIATKFGESGII